MHLIYFLLLGTAGSWLLTWVIINFAPRIGLLDTPNERSSHVLTVPRGGGLSIYISSSLLIIFSYYLDFVSQSELITYLGATSAVALIGLIDDKAHVSPIIRLAVHFSAAILGIFCLNEFSSTLNLYGNSNLNSLLYITLALYTVWLLNLYNFMDGIDGIASIEAVSCCASGMILNILFYNTPGLNEILIILLASSLGFFLWNNPPAKIFMGDVGSGFLGVFLALISIEFFLKNPSSIFSWIIFLGVFITDASVTLLRRLLRRQSPLQAHRSHAYQYASRVFSSHKLVSYSVGGINFFWLLPLGLLAAYTPNMAIVIALLAYAPLIYLSLKFKAGANN